MRFLVRAGVFAAVCCGFFASNQVLSQGSKGPTAEKYAADVGNGAQVVPSGGLKIGGVRVWCGRRPTVLDRTLDDYGAAYPRFLILHPDRMARLPGVVQLWIYSHECGHQFRGADEERADCFAVQRGRRQKWLDPQGLDKICAFISPSKASSMHYSGKKRCEIMRQCYKSKKVY